MAAAVGQRPKVQDVVVAAELARYKVVDLAAPPMRIALAGFVGIAREAVALEHLALHLRHHVAGIAAP